MKKIITVISCLFIMFFFTAASKKPAKPVKAPKATVAGLTKDLNAAKLSILELSAKNITLTAKTVWLETDIKRLNKEKNALLLPLYISVFSALVLAAFIIAGLIGKQSQIKEARKKAASGGTTQGHFDDIEAHVLDDWHNIWYHPEKVNMELYADLTNHYPELYEKTERWKAGISRRGIFTGHLISLLSTKYPDIEGTDSIYLLALDGSEPFIEETEISVGVAVCAHLKKDVASNIRLMKAYYDDVMTQFKGEFREVVEVTNQIAILKDEIDVDIRKIKHFRKIKGNCKYINS